MSIPLKSTCPLLMSLCIVARSVDRRHDPYGLPTHTAVTMSGVQPIVQLSLKYSAVPVLALTRRSGSVSGPLAPKSITRLASLLVISSMMKATFSGTTRRALVAGSSLNMVLPAVAQDDVVDGARVVVHAEVGERRRAVGELQRRHRVAAERCRVAGRARDGRRSSGTS